MPDPYPVPDTPTRIDTTPSKVATAALNNIPFGSIIGGPLSACIEAQAQAAQTSWDFIRNVGMQTDRRTGERKAINVQFLFMKDGKIAQLNVPLLTIVPIPYIAVKTIDINFKANINASSSSSNMEASSTSVDGGVSGETSLNLGLFKFRAAFNANYSSKKDSKATQDSQYSVEYTMDVAVHAEQDGMPAGLAKVLELLGNALDVTDPAGTLDVNEQLFRGAPGDKAQLIATYKNRDGLFEPDKLTIAGVEGRTEGNSRIFDLPIVEGREKVYIVSVLGADKTVKVRTVDVVTAGKQRELARLDREQKLRSLHEATEKEIAERRAQIEAEQKKKADERAEALRRMEEEEKKGNGIDSASVASASERYGADD